MFKTDLLTLLEREHRELEGQLKMLVSTGEACRCIDFHVLRKLVQRLGLHVEVEGAYLYPQAKDEREVNQLIPAFYDEQQEIKTLLDSLHIDHPLTELEVGTMLTACRKLLTVLQRHVHEEEGQLFPVLRRQWDEEVLLELGDKMLEMKDRELSKH